jgi:hypothetical protein
LLATSSSLGRFFPAAEGVRVEVGDAAKLALRTWLFKGRRSRDIAAASAVGLSTVEGMPDERDEGPAETGDEVGGWKTARGFVFVFGFFAAWTCGLLE